MSRPFVMDEPIELADGTLRCQAHHMEICGVCCVDYTYMRDSLQEDADDVEDSDDSGRYPSADEEARMQSSKRVRCAVCRKPAPKKCSRCKSVYYCGPEHQVEDWKVHKQQCKARDAPVPKPRLLLVTVGGMHELVDSMSDDFFAMIEDKMTISRAVDAAKATCILTSSTRPRSVIVGDLIDPKRHSALLGTLIQYAKKGGTVIFGLGYPNFARPGAFKEIFARFGLSWKSGPYSRLYFDFNPDKPSTKRLVQRRPRVSNKEGKSPKEELLERSVNPLPDTYSMKSLRLTDVPLDQAIYLEQGGRPTRNQQLFETPVAFAPVGKGWVGYIGDVNNEAMSQFVLKAMIGLRIPPTKTRSPSPPADEQGFYTI